MSSDHDLDDIGNLRDIEQRGDARCDILARRVGREQDMAVSARKADDQGGYAFGQLVRVGGAVSSDHLGNTRDLCGFDGSAGATAFSGNQHMHVAGNSGGGGDGVQNDGNDCRIIVIGDDQDCHQMTPASFLSLSTSSATDSTFTPPSRFAGSVTLSVVRRGATSTPRSSGLISSMGFFFAFMMFGSDA